MREPDRVYYLTVPPDLGLGARCVTAGTASSAPGARYPPHALRHPHRYRAVASEGRVLHERQLVLIDEGRGRFWSHDGTETIVESGTIILVRPGVWHRYAPEAQTGWREYWVGVAGPAVESAAQSLRLDDRSPLWRLRAPEEAVGLFLSVLRLADQSDAASHLEIIAEVFRMLVLLARSRLPAGIESGPPLVERAKGLMGRRVTAAMRIDELCEELGVSGSALRRRFIAETGLSPYHYYMTLKVNAVKRELAHTALPLKAVAERFGFTDQYHLSRVFSRYAGVSPSQWRRCGG